MKSGLGKMFQESSQHLYSSANQRTTIITTDTNDPVTMDGISKTVPTKGSSTMTSIITPIIDMTQTLDSPPTQRKEENDYVESPLRKLLSTTANLTDVTENAQIT